MGSNVLSEDHGRYSCQSNIRFRFAAEEADDMGIITLLQIIAFAFGIKEAE